VPFFTVKYLTWEEEENFLAAFIKAQTGPRAEYQ